MPSFSALRWANSDLDGTGNAVEDEDRLEGLALCVDVLQAGIEVLRSLDISDEPPLKSEM